MEGVDLSEISDLMKTLERDAYEIGLELAPLKVGWYNRALEDKSYSLDYPADTFALTVINNPSFFGKVFAKHLEFHFEERVAPGEGGESKDLFDECVKATLEELTVGLRKHLKIRFIYDFDMDHATYRPDMLAQVAAHCSGMARCYRRQDLDKAGVRAYKELSEGEVDMTKVYPVCWHPKYGGWFGIRCLMIFQGVQTLSLRQKDPTDGLESGQFAKLLYLYNNHWADETWRDVGLDGRSDVEKYSEAQRQYFAQPPDQRTEEFVKDILEKLKHEVK